MKQIIHLKHQFYLFYYHVSKLNSNIFFLITIKSLALNCQTGSKEPKFQNLFHKKRPPQQFTRRTLIQAVIKHGV